MKTKKPTKTKPSKPDLLAAIGHSQEVARAWQELTLATLDTLTAVMKSHGEFAEKATPASDGWKNCIETLKVVGELLGIQDRVREALASRHEYETARANKEGKKS